MALIHRSIHLVFLACIVSVMVSYLIPRDAHAAPANSKAERGRYLVESFGCSDCHTPMRFEMFVKAMRGGRHMGGTGRPIYPPMPWTSLRNMTGSDLGAIFAWLKTIPAVRNEVPEVRVAARGEGAVIRMNTAIAGE